jgi:Domain of unknown function (DUF4158)
MPRRFLLSAEQRTRLFAIPVDYAEMAKHYVLSADDLALVRASGAPSTGLGSLFKAAFTDYALRDQTRREHAVELQEHLHLQGFRLAHWRACLQVGTDTAWATDRGEPIVRAMLAHLRAVNTCSSPPQRYWNGSD